MGTQNAHSAHLWNGARVKGMANEHCYWCLAIGT
jgi:hypothetical protein